MPTSQISIRPNERRQVDPAIVELRALDQYRRPHRARNGQPIRDPPSRGARATSEPRWHDLECKHILVPGVAIDHPLQRRTQGRRPSTARHRRRLESPAVAPIVRSCFDVFPYRSTSFLHKIDVAVVKNWGAL